MANVVISPVQNILDTDCTDERVAILAEEFMAPSTLSHAFEAVSQICSAHQYDHFLIATAPNYNDQIKMENILLTNLPAHLTHELINMEQSGDWSILLGIENTLAPFCWHEQQGLVRKKTPDSLSEDLASLPHDASIADRLFMEQIGTTTIHCVQTPTRDHKRAFIAAFSRSTKCIIPPEFVLAFLRIFDRIERLTDKCSIGAGADLTVRELECLRWASVGKTSAEISVIAGLSEHTVNHYLNSSCKKLDCLNRTQAVATVLRSGIIT